MPIDNVHLISTPIQDMTQPEIIPLLELGRRGISVCKIHLKALILIFTMPDSLISSV